MPLILDRATPPHPAIVASTNGAPSCMETTPESRPTDYPVTGRTWPELRSQFKGGFVGDRKAPGNTVVTVTQSCDGAAGVVTPHVSVQIVVHLPAWERPEDATISALEWAVWIGRLEDHELAPVGIARYGYACLASDMARADSCAAAHVVYEHTVSQVNARQDEFDASSHHGADPPLDR